VKIRNSAFSIGQNFGSIDQNSKKIILEFLDGLIAIWFLFNQSKGPFNRSKFEKLNFLVTVQKGWRGFKPCKRFYETF